MSSSSKSLLLFTLLKVELLSFAVSTAAGGGGFADPNALGSFIVFSSSSFLPFSSFFEVDSLTDEIFFSGASDLRPPPAPLAAPRPPPPPPSGGRLPRGDDADGSGFAGESAAGERDEGTLARRDGGSRDSLGLTGDVFGDAGLFLEVINWQDWF
jgi:hypothetical protein